MKERIENDVNVILCFFNNIIVKKIIESYFVLNFKSFIEDIKESLLMQCDFNNEVNNALLFKNNFKNKKNIIIPHVYKHFTETFDEVIVMEYIDGPIAKNVSLDKLEHHFEKLQSFFFDSLYRYNILHADFHLGNIIVMDDNTLGIIDFGIVYELTPEISDALFDLIFMVTSLDSTEKSFHKKSCKIIKLSIELCCQDEHVYNLVYNKIISDLHFMNMFKENFSVNKLMIIIKKLISIQDDTIVLKSNTCQLFLAALSGIQTIEYINNGQTLQSLLRSFINKSIKI
jgi:ubiquinone biosynthesis protein